MIVIVDYGMGNLGSVLNMLRKIGADAQISRDKKVIEKADKLILPGVGAFDNAMKNLEKLDLIEVLNQKVLGDKTPVLGVCLGMQLLGTSSEEGTCSGLGWIDAKTIRFSFADMENELKVPHMGWNTVQVNRENPFFSTQELNRFYFVHSYYVSCTDPADILTTTQYGYAFTSSVWRDNIVGMQFHPEKSHRFGKAVLKRFAEEF